MSNENIASCKENPLKISDNIKKMYTFSDFTKLSDSAQEDKSKLNIESIRNLYEYRKDVFDSLIGLGITIKNDNDIDNVAKNMKEFGYSDELDIKKLLKEKLLGFGGPFNVYRDRDSKKIKTEIVVAYLRGISDHTDLDMPAFNYNATHNGLELSCDKTNDQSILDKENKQHEDGIKFSLEINDLRSVNKTLSNLESINNDTVIFNIINQENPSLFGDYCKKKHATQFVLTYIQENNSQFLVDYIKMFSTGLLVNNNSNDIVVINYINKYGPSAIVDQININNPQFSKDYIIKNDFYNFIKEYITNIILYLNQGHSEVGTSIDSKYFALVNNIKKYHLDDDRERLKRTIFKLANMYGINIDLGFHFLDY